MLTSKPLPSLQRSIATGAIGFGIVSLCVFATVAFAERWMYQNLGLLGSYLTWTVLFILLSGAVFGSLVVERSQLRGVVSFNFDGLLEEDLAKRNVPTVSLVDGTRQHSNAFRIIHPHGFGPQHGPIERGHLVFTEDDYHKLTETVFHWGLSEIVSELRHNTVLFIGLSMSDPSLRRLLDACRNSDIPPHWQLQQRHQVHDREQLAAINDVANRSRHWGEILGYNEQKDPPQLAEALNDALRQADTYDRALFEAMGVKTIWLESFDDIPILLDKIPRISKKKS